MYAYLWMLKELYSQYWFRHRNISIGDGITSQIVVLAMKQCFCCYHETVITQQIKEHSHIYTCCYISATL